MERIMLGITLRDRKYNPWIRQQIGVTDIIEDIKKSKHQWVGHVARLQDNRWTIRGTDWLPREWIRPRGRPKIRWWDDLVYNPRPLDPKWRAVATAPPHDTRHVYGVCIHIQGQRGWSLPGSLSSWVVPLRTTQCQWDATPLTLSCELREIHGLHCYYYY